MRGYAALLVAIGQTAACSMYSGAEDGENGVLGFYEPNSYPGDDASDALGFDSPLALGARADVWVLGPGVTSLESAEIDDPNIISLRQIIYPIQLRAEAVGQTRLHVSTTGGADSLLLSVVQADSVRLWSESETGLFDKPDGFFGTGLALRPGASREIAGRPMAGSTELIGFDVIQWQRDPALLDIEDVSGTVNTVRVTAKGVSGIATVSTQLGGSYEYATLSATDPTTMRLYSFVDTQNPELSALASTDVGNFYLGVTDAAGRTVKPGPTDDITVSVLSGTVTVLDADIGGHVAGLRACTGSGVVRISYAGASRDVAIDVAPANADAACP